MKQIQLISDFKAREYQESIFANCLDRNSLVVLPTGLGKTVVAVMLCVYYFNKNPGKKFLFLAPTKPLVEQQKKSFEGFFSNSDEFRFEVLTGMVPPKKRVGVYKESDFIFSTPQLIENDIVNGIIDMNDFSLVVLDEAHRGTGNYAYTFIAEQFDKVGCNILALSASPGTSKADIENIIDNLRIEHIEVKKYEDRDVKPYVFKTKTEHVKVELDDKFKSISAKLRGTYAKRLSLLQGLGFLMGKKIGQVTKKDLLDLQTYLRMQISSGDADSEVWEAISVAAGLMKLDYGIELFESQEVSSAHTYFYNFFRKNGDSSKAAQALLVDANFRDSFDEISKLHKAGVMHPKLIKLTDIVRENVLKNPDLKIIVFSSYRDTAQKIVMELNKVRGIDSVIFVGQAKKGEVKMSQKEQKEVIEKFRSGEFNVLVSTSVGEEGLDIPKVDMVIFYEPVPSAIRTIQRVGRTGRFKKGEAYILQTEGTRDVITSFVASAKERKMYRVLDEVRKKFSGGGVESKVRGVENRDKNQKGLGEFIKKEGQRLEKGDRGLDSGDRRLENKGGDGGKIDAVDDRIPIYVDNRENNDLVKSLFNSEIVKIETKNLDVGDIVISEMIAIERKAKIDFVNSIIDKRLFPQLISLAKNYRKPVLILEGNENIFSLRNVNPNVIRATLSAIAVDLRMPIIYTSGIDETRSMIEVMAKRAYKPKKEISLAGDKRAFSENDEIEKVVSTIPKVNVMTAKILLSHFGSLKEIVNASLEDFLEIDGIGKVRAKYLVEFFAREYNHL